MVIQCLAAETKPKECGADFTILWIYRADKHKPDGAASTQLGYTEGPPLYMWSAVG